MPHTSNRSLALLAALACASSSLSTSLAAPPYEQLPEKAASRAVGDAEKPAEEQPEPAVQASDLKGGPTVKWIWGSKPARDREVWWLTRTFDAGDVQSAQVIATCDNEMEVYLNGKRILASSNWQNPVTRDVSRLIEPKGNTFAVRADNEGTMAGFALKLVLTPAKGAPTFVVTDETWRVAKKKDATETAAAVVVGKMGDAPWQNVFANPGSGPTLAGGERDVFQTLPGFEVERLFTVPKSELGSWVCMTTDGKGRLIVSDQGKEGLCRVTPSPIGSDQPTKVEKLDLPITSCQGMLWAFDRLYCSVNGGPGSGFYVCEDTNGDDALDKVTKLKDFQGGGEHGPHAVRLAPDGKSLYVIAGNHTDPPKDFDASRLPSNWSEDHLLPRQWDARGHARGKLAPGGWVAKTDPEGKTWEIVSSGYRNPYDMDFNADGELFAYDADMEWDFGTPWYRPTRVVHATSGSEFGWRSGTGKWPTWYTDSLPPAVDIGPGSPVGATFGYGAKFPAKYQQALFILDWTFGTMYAIHLTPDGASYSAEKEEFVSRTPLPLTDAVVGRDGALYFTVGGRGTQSELFRVTYTGEASTQPVDATNRAGTELRALRHDLEKHHHAGRLSAAELARVWEHLGHEDRFIRYAARVALEHQPVDSWRDRFEQESDADRLIQSAIAIARQGTKADRDAVLAALHQRNVAALTERQQLDLLRAYSLVFVRLGEPDQATKSELAKRFEPFFPAKGEMARELNRELSSMLVYLESPTIVTKVLAEMEKPYERSIAEMGELLTRNAGYGGKIAAMLANQPQVENLHLAFILRNVKFGWTFEQRMQYVQWIEKAKGWSGGESFVGFLDNIKQEALENATEAERKAIAAGVVAYKPPTLDELPKPKGPAHDWTVDDILSLTTDGLTGRDFANGQRAFAAAQCIRCHRMAGEGGATGPDLTNVAGRFATKDLAEALVDPSKVISDQYRASIIVDADGKQHVGRIVNETETTLTILVDPVDMTKVVEIEKNEIEENLPSKVSLMPKDLVKPLGKEELLDLIAYLYSRGNPNDRMFGKQ